MTTSTIPVPCPVVWPIEHSPEELAVMVGAELIPQYARPRHTCKLPAEHVHWTQRTEVRSGYAVAFVDEVVPHQCHCGVELPVRDAVDDVVTVEPAR